MKSSNYFKRRIKTQNYYENIKSEHHNFGMKAIKSEMDSYMNSRDISNNDDDDDEWKHQFK